MEQYELTKNTVELCECIDKANGIIVTWQPKRFNNTQRFTIVNERELVQTEGASRIAHLINGISQFLIENYNELL